MASKAEDDVLNFVVRSDDLIRRLGLLADAELTRSMLAMRATQQPAASEELVRYFKTIDAKLEAITKSGISPNVVEELRNTLKTAVPPPAVIAASAAVSREEAERNKSEAEILNQNAQTLSDFAEKLKRGVVETFRLLGIAKSESEKEAFNEINQWLADYQSKRYPPGFLTNSLFLNAFNTDAAGMCELINTYSETDGMFRMGLSEYVKMMVNKLEEIDKNLTPPEEGWSDKAKEEALKKPNVHTVIGDVSEIAKKDCAEMRVYIRSLAGVMQQMLNIESLVDVIRIRDDKKMPVYVKVYRANMKDKHGKDIFETPAWTVEREDNKAVAISGEQKRFPFKVLYETDHGESNRLLFASIKSRIDVLCNVLQKPNPAFALSSLLIMSYGSSGSGKSYTLFNEMESGDGGIIFAVLDQIMKRGITVKLSDIQQIVFSLEGESICRIEKVSFVKATTKEVPPPPPPQDITTVNDFKSYVPSSAWMEKKIRYRKTALNPKSSRSHLFYTFTLTFEGKTARLRFVDLAGMEQWTILRTVKTNTGKNVFRYNANPKVKASGSEVLRPPWMDTASQTVDLAFNPDYVPINVQAFNSRTPYNVTVTSQPDDWLDLDAFMEVFKESGYVHEHFAKTDTESEKKRKEEKRKKLRAEVTAQVYVFDDFMWKQYNRWVVQKAPKQGVEWKPRYFDAWDLLTNIGSVEEVDPGEHISFLRQMIESIGISLTLNVLKHGVNFGLFAGESEIMLGAARINLANFPQNTESILQFIGRDENKQRKIRLSEVEKSGKTPHLIYSAVKAVSEMVGGFDMSLVIGCVRNATGVARVQATKEALEYLHELQVFKEEAT